MRLWSLSYDSVEVVHIRGVEACDGSRSHMWDCLVTHVHGLSDDRDKREKAM